MPRGTRETRRLAFGSDPPPDSARCSGVRTDSGRAAYQVRRLRDALGARWGKPVQFRGEARKPGDFAMVVLRSRDPAGAGSWRYLLQHRSPTIWGGRKDKGAGMLGLPGGKADLEDEWPDVTAWRETREECLKPEEAEAFTLAAFQDAVVCAAAQPIGGVLDRSRPPVPSDPANTPAHGALFVVDADKLLEAGALSTLEEWVAGPGTPGEVTDEAFPGGHVWVPEAELDGALCKWLGRGARSGHIFGAERKGRPGLPPVTQCDDGWEDLVVGGGSRGPRRRRQAKRSRDRRSGQLARPETKGPPPTFRGVPLWPAVGVTLALYRPALGYSRPLVLYVGVSEAVAADVRKNGLKATGRDCTAMLGEGVYLAGLAKAAKFANLVGDGSSGIKCGRDGVVFMCEVNLAGKEVDVVSPLKPSPDVETAPGYVDYCGCWGRLGYPAAFAPGGTSSRLPEFVVGDLSLVAVKRELRLKAPPGMEPCGATTGGSEPEPPTLQAEYGRILASGRAMILVMDRLTPLRVMKKVRTAYEARAALERWAMARINGAEEAAAEGLEAELRGKWKLSREDAGALQTELRETYDARPESPKVSAKCSEDGIHLVRAERDLFLGGSARVHELVALGGCEATATMMARYQGLFPQGQQWGVPFAMVETLHSAGVRNEGFASPLNSRMLGMEGGKFFSAFPEVDGPFGSCGSFFQARVGDHPGGWLINPPFVERLMALAAEWVVKHVSEIEGPVVFVMPAWRDSKAYNTLRALVADTPDSSEETLTAGTYGYESDNPKWKGRKKIPARFESVCFAFGWPKPDWTNFRLDG